MSLFVQTEDNIKQKKKGAALWEYAKGVIPGGNQLLSKRSEMFLPESWPAYYEKAKGIYLWDLEGERYMDFSLMGMGTCVLGYANQVIDQAVKKAINKGNISTLNCYEEVELAERLIALHPWSGMVRFAKTGGEACAIAIRIARAATGREKILFCGYHGWHDWYLAANLGNEHHLDEQLFPGLKPQGLPRSLKNTAVPFHYGNIEEFESLVSKNPAEIAAIIMEVQRGQTLNLYFLNQVKNFANQIGAILIFDEVTSGFRMRIGGMHMLYDIYPDLFILGKAMGNGYPISAVIGKKSIMDAAQETFISSTYWGERIGFSAALEVIRFFERYNVSDFLVTAGEEISNGLTKIFASHSLKIEITGIKPAPLLNIFEKNPLLIKTIFTQEMLKHGFLASTSIYLSYAHTRRSIGNFLNVADSVFSRIAKALKKDELELMLEGPVCHSGFQRLV